MCPGRSLHTGRDAPSTPLSESASHVLPFLLPHEAITIIVTTLVKTCHHPRGMTRRTMAQARCYVLWPTPHRRARPRAQLSEPASHTPAYPPISCTSSLPISLALDTTCITPSQRHDSLKRDDKLCVPRKPATQRVCCPEHTTFSMSQPVMPLPTDDSTITTSHTTPSRPQRCRHPT